jgi:catechol 2,3-dioxygenase-like lactoylglutathione lyase family enzyme
MPPVLKSTVAATYVRDIDASREFYQLLGFAEHSAGKAESSAWCALHHSGQRVLLAATRPPLEVPHLPLLFYFFFDDLAGVIAALETGGVEVERLGRAPHALGGEARVTDPDGNTILLGQPEPSVPGQQLDAVSRFSLLKEAAAVAAKAGVPAVACQITDERGAACANAAEVRLADAAGTSAWACLSHAEEILIVVPGAFVADESDDGIAAFLARRHG